MTGRTWKRGRTNNQPPENGSNTPVRLFMGVGELEGNVAEFQQFAEDLKAKKVKDLEFETLVMKNTGHAGTKPEGFARGLQYVFERPSLLLAPAVLNKYFRRIQLRKGYGILIQ